MALTSPPLRLLSIECLEAGIYSSIKLLFTAVHFDFDAFYCHAFFATILLCFPYLITTHTNMSLSQYDALNGHTEVIQRGYCKFSDVK